MADKQIKISNVEIEVAGKQLRLTLEQAKELRDILMKAFPTVQEVKHIYEPYTPRWWYQSYSSSNNQAAAAQNNTMKLIANTGA